MAVVIFGESNNAGTVKCNNNTNNIVLSFNQLVMSKILEEIGVVLEVRVALRHDILLRRVRLL